MLAAFTFLLFLFLATLGGSPAGAVPPPAWLVVSVQDGDSVRAIDDQKTEHRVRLVGIDAPERGQAFGTVARNRLAELVLRKQVVVKVEGRDRFGRVLATLEAGGQVVNRQLVAEGLAWHYKQFSDDAELAAAEADARARRRGLWADPNPVPPWEWRRREADRKAPAGP